MALTSETRSVSYTGNGSTTSFSFGHLFFADADLVVKVDGTTKTLTTDYTVAGAGEQAGGTVTFGTAPAADTSITIERVVDFTQPTSLRTQGNYSPKVHENALDRATMQTQQLDARVTTAQADADALDVRLTTAETDIADLQAHDATEDAAVDLIDARVSALEAGDSPPAPTTEDYTGVASASTRDALTITEPSDGSSLTAASLTAAINALADRVASLVAHAALLDLPGTLAIDWTAPTLLNSFANYVETNAAPAGYLKDAQGFVRLRGKITGGAASTANPIFTLPAGFRPATDHDQAVVLSSLSGTVWLKVRPSGDVFLWAAPGGTYDGSFMSLMLGGVSFLAEQ